MLIEAVFWVGLGLILGSFTNVLILRRDSGSAFAGRSACPNCHTQLRWYELFPVLSFLLLQGRCGTCQKGISWQYPAVEILTAILCLVVGLSPAPLFVRVLGTGIIVLLVAIAVYDLYYTIIPDSWVWTFNILAFFSALFFPLAVGSWQLVVLAGPITTLPLFLLWGISAGKWMGFGDVKFALGMGWLLGIFPGYVSLVLAFILGAIVGVLILLPLPYLVRIGVFIAHFTPYHFSLWGQLPLKSDTGFTMKSEVPFGPFLVLATCIVWFSTLYGIDITALYLRLFVF